MVVFIHTKNNEKDLQVINYIIYLAVPYFFIASGFFIGKKMKDATKQEINIILKERNKKAIKQYFLWTLIYLPLTIYGIIAYGQGILNNCTKVICGVFFWGENFDSWQLWYLLSMIYGLLLIRLIYNKINKNKNRIITIVIIFFISQLMPLFLQNIDNFDGLAFYAAKILNITLGYSNARIFRGLIYIFIGIQLSNINVKINKKINISIIILLGLLYVFVNQYVQQYIILIASVLIFILSINIDKINFDTIFLRKASTVIYFTHMFFYFIYSVIIHGQATYLGIGAIMFCILSSLAFSIIICVIQKKKKIRILTSLFG